MLVCDMCDKGYHTFCLQPAIDSLPTNGWRCKVRSIFRDRTFTAALEGIVHNLCNKATYLQSFLLAAADFQVIVDPQETTMTCSESLLWAIASEPWLPVLRGTEILEPPFCLWHLLCTGKCGKGLCSNVCVLGAYFIVVVVLLILLRGLP